MRYLFYILVIAAIAYVFYRSTHQNDDQPSENIARSQPSYQKAVKSGLKKSALQIALGPVYTLGDIIKDGYNDLKTKK